MSKAKALKALKRRRMMATNGYSGHLLDLWGAVGYPMEDFEFPGRHTGGYRQYLKAQYFKNRNVRQEVRP